MKQANKTYDELSPGDEASVTRVCTANDLVVFAHASGNLNPLHMPHIDGGNEREAVAPSMWVGALVSAVLGNILPGPGTLYRSQSFTFFDRVHIGDELTVKVKVLEKRPGNLVVLETLITGRGGDAVAHGTAEVLAPTRKLEVETENVPGMLVHRHKHFERLLAACKDLAPLATAVVAPDEDEALIGALAAAEHGLIRPILVGDKARISGIARKLRADISHVELIDVPGHREASARAVELVREGKADALMKGNLHTGDLMREVIRHPGGLRSARRVSHVFVFDVPGVDHLLLVSDAAINIAPSLEHKVDIVQNAIDVARALGIERPKVGILSALETVNIKIPSTLDAAILSKMAERGQIKGGIVDGPLAMDNAVDVTAARTRGISSLVAGRAEVLIVPNVEAGSMLAKELVFIAHADGAGLAVGAQVPIILTNRADDSKSRLVSCAMALLYREWARGRGQSANSAPLAAE